MKPHLGYVLPARTHGSFGPADPRGTRAVRRPLGAKVGAARRSRQSRAVLASAAFKIPIAATTAGRLVAPEDAERGVRYGCPSCSGAVTLHAGERKARHFHHRRSACSVETVLHVSAKRLIVQAVEA